MISACKLTANLSFNFYDFSFNKQMRKHIVDEVVNPANGLPQHFFHKVRFTTPSGLHLDIGVTLWEGSRHRAQQGIFILSITLFPDLHLHPRNTFYPEHMIPELVKKVMPDNQSLNLLAMTVLNKTLFYFKGRKSFPCTGITVYDRFSSLTP